MIMWQANKIIINTTYYTSVFRIHPWRFQRGLKNKEKVQGILKPKLPTIVMWFPWYVVAIFHVRWPALVCTEIMEVNIILTTNK